MGDKELEEVTAKVENLAKELSAVINKNIPDLTPAQIINALAITCAGMAELSKIPMENFIEQLGEKVISIPIKKKEIVYIIEAKML